MENNMNAITVTLTKYECRNLADFIQHNLIREIREDENLENIVWIKTMIDLMQMFEEYGDATLH